MRLPATAAALLLAAAAIAFAVPAAASGAYLKIGSITGESSAAGHVGWIEVESFIWQSAPPSVPGRTGVATAGPSSLGLSKKSDKASPALQNAAVNGTPFPSATLEVQGSTAGGSLRYELKNVMVSSYKVGGGGGGPVPTESFSLNFSSIETHYPEPVAPQGTPKPGSWDVGRTKGDGYSAPTGAGAPAVAFGAAKAPPAVTKVTPSVASLSVGASVTFTVEATGDCQRSRIDFGDGSPVVEYPIVSGKSQPAPMHSYTKGGTFTVKAYGLADPWAMQKAPPKSSDHACMGHATTSVAAKSTMAVAPAFRK